MNKRKLALIFVIALGLFLSSSNYQFQLTTVHAGDWEEVDHIDSMEGLNTGESQIIEGKLVSQSFALAASSTNFVDVTQAQTYGTTTNVPPNGMGADDATHSTLQEASFSSYGYPTVASYTGGSLPSGWYNYQWTFGSTYASIVGFSYSSGQFWTDQYDMSAYTGVRVKFDWKNDGFENTEYDELYCVSHETSDVTWFHSPAGRQNSYTTEQRDSGWDSTLWRVRWYATGLTGDVESWEGFDIDNIYLYGQTTDTYYRFEAVYRFDTVTHTYPTERLYIDYDAGTSQEGLSYYGGITTNPTDFIGGTSGAEPDTSFDVHDELTGTPFYVKIRDLTRTDGDQDSWLIDRLYLIVSNNAPTNDGTPTIATLDDTDKLYSRYRKYEITTYHKDLDGYEDINYVLLDFQTEGEVTQFRGRFDQDTHIFSEEAGVTYWELDTAGSTYSENVNDFDVTWKFYIEWACPDIVNIILECYVEDSAPEHDTDAYGTTWDIETDLEYDVTPTVTDDDAGIVDRGDLDEAFHITGDVSYQGSALTPPSGDVDVWVSMTVGGWGTNIGPWEDDTVDAGGTFDVTCYADDAVGIETYTVKVVKEGTGYGGTDLIGGADPTDDYIADEIEVYYSTVSDARTNIDEQEWPLFRLRLKYDNHLLNDGTNDAVQINGSAATWSAGDSSWYKYYTQSTVDSWNFLVTSASENTYGITTFDSTSAETYDGDIIWDRIYLSGSGLVADDYREFYLNEITVTAYVYYEFDDAPVTTGKVYLNGAYEATHGVDEQWFYVFDFNTIRDLNITSITTDGLDTHGITAINNNDKFAYVIWDQIKVIGYGCDDTRINYGATSSCTITLYYAFDDSYVTTGDHVYLRSGAVEVLYSGANGIWNFNETISSVLSYTYNDINVQDDEYALNGVEDQNGQSLEVIWDRVQVQSYSASDARDNINNNVNIDVTLWYDYDNTNVTDGTVTINGYSAAHQGNGVWRITRTSASVTSVTYNTVAVTGNTHGITVEDQNGQSQQVIWDAIGVNMWIDDGRDNIDDTITVYAWLTYMYDATNVTDGTVLLNGTGMSYGSSIWSLGRSQSTAGLWAYNITSISGNTHGITIIGESNFNNAEQDYVSIPAEDNISGQMIEGFTVSFWAWRSSEGWAGGVGAVGSKSIWCGFVDDRPYLLLGNGTDWNIVAIYGHVSIQAWHLITYTYDNATGWGYVYADGVQIGDDNGSFDNSGWADREMRIGFTAAGYYFNGSISDVRIYNRSLDVEEIFELYQGRYSNNTGLILHLPITSYDVADGIWYDQSGEGYDGTIVGTIVNATAENIYVRPIWDAIGVNMWIDDGRDNIDDTITVYAWLTYMYDATNVTDGTVLLNGTGMSYSNQIWSLGRSQSTVGLWAYNITSISGNAQGITVIGNVYNSQASSSTVTVAGGLDGLANSSGATFSFWIHVNWDYVTYYQVLMGQGSDCDHYIAIASSVQHNLELDLRYADGTDDRYNSRTNLSAYINTWVHITYVFDGSAQKTYVYVNGELAADSYGVYYSDTEKSILPDVTGDAFKLYQNPFGANPFYNSILHDVRVYNRTLGASEIFELYQGRYANDTGLLLHYGANSIDVADSTWYDLSDEGNDGTLYVITVSATIGELHVRPIWDEIEVFYSIASDTRTNIDEQEYSYFRLRLKYDNHLLDDGTYDDVNINGSVATWSGVGATGGWYKFYTMDTVGSWNFLVTSASEDTYGITAFDSSSAVSFDIDIIWDSLTITITGPTDNRQNLNANATGIYVSAIYDYDSEPYDGTFTLNNTDYDGDGTVVKWGYTVTSASGDSYGITAISTNDDTYHIWDRAQVYYFVADDYRTSIDMNIEVRVRAWLEYDKHNLTSGDSISVNGTALTWDGTNEWFDYSFSQSTVGRWCYNVTSMTEATYTITAFEFYTGLLSDDSSTYARTTSVDDFKVSNYSCEIWFKWVGDSWTYSASFTGTRYNDNGFMLYRNSGWSDGTLWWLLYYTNTTAHSGSELYTYAAHYGLELDTWYHSVVVVNSSGYSWSYINGELDHAYNPPSDFDYWDVTGVSYFNIGGHYATTGVQQIGDVRFYNRTLSATEIYEHYYGVFDDESGLVAHYAFSGNLIDSAGNHDLSVVGSGRLVNEGNPLWLVWDRVYMTDWNTPDQRDNVGDQQINTAKFWLEYDDYSLQYSGSGQYTCEGAYMTWASGTQLWYRTLNYAYVHNETVTISAVNELTFGVTVFTNTTWATWIVWDRILIVTTTTDDARIGYDTQATIAVTAELEYDGHALGSGDTLYMNGTAMSWNGTHFILNPQFAEVDQWNFFANSTSASEATYGITVINLDGNNVNQIWDRVNVDMAVNMTWTVIGYYANVSYTGTYEYDSAAWTGYATIVNTSLTTGDEVHYEELTFATVDNRTFYATAVEDAGGYDLTAFTTDTEWCIWDDIVPAGAVDYSWSTPVSPNLDSVNLHWGAGSNWEWDYNDTLLEIPVTFTSYSNGSTPSGVGGTYGSGAFGGLTTGLYSGATWDYLEFDVNVTATIAGIDYDWEIWSVDMPVIVPHSLQTVMWDLNREGDYYTLLYHTNYENGSAMVWDDAVIGGGFNGSVYYGNFEGMCEWLRDTTVLIHNCTILLNAGGDKGAVERDYVANDLRLWYNFTYEISPAILAITDPVYTASDDQNFLSGETNVGCDWYAYNNDTEMDTGVLGTGSFAIDWNKNTTVGYYVWGVKFDDGTTIRWVNGTFEVDVITYALDWDFGLTETNVFVTGYQTLISDYTIYEDDIEIGSGAITSLSFWLEWARQSAENPLTVDVAVKFISGTTTIWTNFSYTEVQIMVFRVEVYDFYLTDVFVNFYVRSTWNNATIYAYDNSSLVGSFSEGAFFWYKDTDYGLHLLELNVTSGANVITLNPAYFIPVWSETALAVTTFSIMNMQENHTLLTITSNWQNCTVDVYLNSSIIVTNAIEGMINMTRPTNVGLYNLTIVMDGGTQIKTLQGWIYISELDVAYDYSSYSSMTYVTDEGDVYIEEGDVYENPTGWFMDQQTVAILAVGGLLIMFMAFLTGRELNQRAIAYREAKYSQ